MKYKLKAMNGNIIDINNAEVQRQLSKIKETKTGSNHDIYMDRCVFTLEILGISKDSILFQFVH